MVQVRRPDNQQQPFDLPLVPMDEASMPRLHAVAIGTLRSWRR
jgi:hypothetical protein